MNGLLGQPNDWPALTNETFKSSPFYYGQSNKRDAMQSIIDFYGSKGKTFDPSKVYYFDDEQKNIDGDGLGIGNYKFKFGEKHVGINARQVSCDNIPRKPGEPGICGMLTEELAAWTGTKTCIAPVPQLFDAANPGIFVSMLDRTSDQLSQGFTITKDFLSKLGEISNQAGKIAISVLNKNLPLNVYAASTRNMQDIINVGVFFDPTPLLPFVQCTWVTDSGSAERTCTNNNCQCSPASDQQLLHCKQSSAGNAGCNVKCSDNTGTCATVKWCPEDMTGQNFASQYGYDGGIKMCTFKPQYLNTMIDAAVQWRKDRPPQGSFRETEIDTIVPNIPVNQQKINDAIIGFIITDLCNGEPQWSDGGTCHKMLMNNTVDQMKDAVKAFNDATNKQVKLYRLNGLKRDQYNGTPSVTWEKNNYQSSFNAFAEEIPLS